MVLHVVKHYLKMEQNGRSYLHFSLAFSTGEKDVGSDYGSRNRD